ncbi:MAG: hypothetical protein JO345_33145 [Streptosporangiaceae bacterium]|nr:hypothetical protein [Streptosporangiaceae bacterium]
MGAIRSRDCGRTACLAERLATLQGNQCRHFSAREPSHRPQGWNTAPIAHRDFHDSNQQVPISVVGVHGGAGTSTVARLLSASDAGRRWPNPDKLGYPLRMVLTARTSAAGLMAASQALARYCAMAHPEGPYLVGFVLVADAPGRLPKPLNRRIHILTSTTMVFRLPWVREWRLSETTPDPRTEWPVVLSLRSFVEHAALTTTPAMH